MTTSEKTKRISAAEAKAHLSSLMARVAHGGERFIIERRGKPMAALVAAEDLQRIEGGNEDKPKGALALLGAWPDATDEEIDSFLEDVYAERERDRGRPVPPLE